VPEWLLQGNGSHPGAGADAIKWEETTYNKQPGSVSLLHLLFIFGG